MANRDLTSDEKTALELLIDATDASAVLIAFSEICAEKAEHIRTNYNDHTLARRWDTLAGALGCQIGHTEAVS